MKFYKRKKQTRSNKELWNPPKRVPVKQIYSDGSKLQVVGRRFYKTAEWRNLRKEFLSMTAHKCRRCNRKINGNPGKRQLHVDHVIPVREDYSKAFSMDNLQVLCKNCHVYKTCIKIEKGVNLDFRTDEQINRFKNYKPTRFIKNQRIREEQENKYLERINREHDYELMKIFQIHN